MLSSRYTCTSATQGEHLLTVALTKSDANRALSKALREGLTSGVVSQDLYVVALGIAIFLEVAGGVLFLLGSPLGSCFLVRALIRMRRSVMQKSQPLTHLFVTS